VLINHLTGEIWEATHQSPTPDPAATSGEPTLGTADDSPRIVRGSDYLALPRSAETWLVQPLLPVGGSLLLYGDPKVGKSFAGLQLACALATGGEWLGFRAPSPCRVVYIQLDTPRSLWADRVQNLKSSGFPTDEVWFADRETLRTWPFDILAQSHQSMLHKSLADISPDVVIIDTLREAHRGDENDSTDMQNVLSHLTAVVKPAALIVVAHGKKVAADQSTSLINDNRGSNYVVGAVDTICHFTKSGMEVGGRAIEEQFIELARLPNYTWVLTERERLKNLARDVMRDGGSLREKARTLAAKSGKTEAACLSLLHRGVSQLA
jgi:hypothetical protein